MSWLNASQVSHYPHSYRLTNRGQEAFRLLEAMRKAALLPAPDQLKHNWRFRAPIFWPPWRLHRKRRGALVPGR